jgi:diacylglycerol kinase family enzyme
MRATLIHNPTAGRAEPIETLIAALQDVGWHVERCMPKEQLNECLGHGADVVVVAGGDGTVGKVAKRLAGTDIPIVIIPTGSANNVARTLGIGVDAKAALSGLAHAKERCIDLGIITSAEKRTKEFFLEGFGMGVFAHVIGEKEETARKKKKLKKAVALIADELETYDAQHYELEIDARDMSGAYILVAVMNMRSFGPALSLAPDAKCDDGALDVVLIGPESRETLVRHLRRAAQAGDIALPSFEVIRAHEVRVRGEGRWTHADERASELHGEVSIQVAASAVRLLVP